MATPPDPADARAASDADATASEMAARLLRRDIVSGALKPGSQLKLRILKARYGIGASPMREALARLVAQGLVHQLSLKGFRVPPLSAAHLADITRSRQLVEVAALKLAIEHGDAAWEDEIVASFRRLERRQHRGRGANARPDVHELDSRHHRFHRALIAACPLQAVKEFCDRLYVQTARYHLLLRRHALTRDAVMTEHRALMRAVLSRNKAEAAKAFKAHVAGAACALLDELSGSPADQPTRARAAGSKVRPAPPRARRTRGGRRSA